MRIDKSLVFEGRYAQHFENLLKFDTLASAELTLAKIDQLYRHFKQQNDRKGMNYCRKLALLGKQRAHALALSSHVGPKKRQEKAEIEMWFTVWLQTPDLFFDWLALRKQTVEFRSKFGADA